VFGVFEVLVVLLIVLGDGLGGLLYVLSIVGEIFFLLWGRYVAGSIASWNNNQLEEVKKRPLSYPASSPSSASDSSSPAPAAARPPSNDRPARLSYQLSSTGSIISGTGMVNWAYFNWMLKREDIII
jgi:hypothetical protein